MDIISRLEIEKNKIVKSERLAIVDLHIYNNYIFL